MSKESYARGLGKVYVYAIEGSDKTGMELVARPGKTRRDHLSGAHARHLSNRAERAHAARSGSSPKGSKKREDR